MALASPVRCVDTAPAAPAPGEPTPLWGIWEMWCDYPVKQTLRDKKSKEQPSSWIDTVKSVGIFDTVEGFWGIHDCTVPPSGLPNGANFYLFRNNIPPMYEHEANRRGGKWVMSWPIAEAARADEAWMKLSLACIGENIPGDEEFLCGVSVSKRKSGFKLSVWTRDAADRATQMRIGFFVKVLAGQQTATLRYIEHIALLDAPQSETASPLGQTKPPSEPCSLGNSPTQSSPPTAFPGCLYTL